MIRRFTGASLVSVMIVVSIAVVLHGQQPPSAADQSRPLRLRATTFTPARGESPPIRADMMRLQTAQARRGVFIVQFRGPILDAWKAALPAEGADILEYVPDFAFKVRMTPGDAARIARLPFIAWVGPFHPAYTLGPEVARNGRRGYVLRIDRGADVRAVEAAIAAAGARVVRRSGSVLMVSAEASALDAIAHVDGLASVENYVPRQKHNEFSGGVIMRGDAANASGFDGSTQTVAIADTGLGQGTIADAHADLPPGRIVSIFNWPGAPDFCFETIIDDGAADVDTGHGTHVATSALGAGDAAGHGRGTAPAARLVFQSIENFAVPSLLCNLLYGIPEAYYLVGIPTDIGELFQQGYDAGARVHSDSWGAEVAGAYNTDSANADAFLWNHRDMAITMSAGNAGTDENGDGVVDPQSVSAPATAKNVITVGASENDRQSDWRCDPSLTYTSCAAQGGQNAIFTYGSGWPTRYFANPLKDDPSAGSAEQMAAFSSRGPTADGRIKPDVVAPGTWVFSGYSDRFQQQYDPTPNPVSGVYQYDGWGFPASPTYKYMGGTSMAAPLVAGGAAVVRDFYQKTLNHPASAALVKATLINSATDLLDENNDGIFDNAYPIPNVHEGWGRVDLANATDGGHQFVDESTPLSTGSSAAFSYPVASGGAPFKITLVWTDYPSTPSAGVNLVNDLDLVVTAPDGTTYVGNAFSGGWSVVGGAPDRINNVESVYLPSAMVGNWDVVVTGYNVPNGPQPFALVVDNASQSPGSGVPVVRAVAADATATEAGPTGGSIRVMRSGDTSAPLAVNYTIGGSSSAGDYALLPGSVTIPEGASEATVAIDPVDDPLVESPETVVLTLAAGAGYDVGSPATAIVTISSDDLPPDLTVTSVTAPPPAAAGGVVTIADTTKNQGTAPSVASETGFYLSTNTTLDAADVFLGSRPVSGLAPGASEPHSTPLQIPETTIAGTYYVIAKADWSAAIIETQETNNQRATAAFRVGPDLIVSLVTAPAAAGPGAEVPVSDTTRNQGADTAAASVTTFYLSTNSAWDAADVALGSRSVSDLAPSAQEAASTPVTIPASTAVGTYYVLARADAEGSVGESLENNNVKASAAIKIGADLTVAALTAPGSAGSGDTIAVAETTINPGGADAPPSTTVFYLSSNTVLDAADVMLGSRAVAALDSGASNGGSVSVTIPSSTAPGTYYIVAKADGENAVGETNENNNTRGSGAVKVGPDLNVFALSAPALAGAGAAFTVTDTVKNLGGGSAEPSEIAFYLSANTALDVTDVLLGSRAVPSLLAGAASPGSVPLVVPPSTATGAYYIVAKIDPANAVTEVTETNNVRSSNIFHVGPDLVVSVLTAPNSARAGTTISVTATTRNQGGGGAGASVVEFYLSTNTALDAADVLLGARTVVALESGMNDAGPTPLTIPAATTPGSRYIIAKADAASAIAETVETNNLRVVFVRIDPP
jgi:subtilase family serine protease